MKIRTFAFLSVFVLMVPLVVFGATFRAGDNQSVTAGETVQDDLYMAGGSISNAGIVAGDFYAAGGTVLMSGSVRSDLTASGGTVMITGNVGDDVRVGGGTVIIESGAGGDVLVAGGQVTIAGKRVGGDVLVAGGTVRIDAPVGGDVRVGGGEIYINAPVGGNVKVDAGELKLGPAAVIAGTLTYRSPKEAVMEEGARVIGAVSYEPRAHRDGKKEMASFLFAWLTLKVLMLIALALALGLLFQRYSVAVVGDVVLSPWLQVGKGLVAFVALPVLSVLLLTTVVGIPFGVLGLLSFVALIIVSCAFAPILMGALLYKWITKRSDYVVTWKTILLGVVAYMILFLIPLVGSLVISLFVLAAAGAIMGLKWRIIKEWR